MQSRRCSPLQRLLLYCSSATSATLHPPCTRHRVTCIVILFERIARHLGRGGFLCVHAGSIAAEEYSTELPQQTDLLDKGRSSGLPPGIGRFTSATGKAAARDLALTVGSRGVQMLIGLAGNVLSARALGPADLGRFGVVVLLVTVGGTVADAGLTYATIRFIARNSEQAPARAQSAARIYFLMRLCTGLSATLLCVLLSAPVAANILGSPQLTPLLQLSFLTLISLSISSYPGTVLAGLSMFGRSAVAGLLNAAITVGGIAILFAANSLNLPALVAWNVCLPLASTLPAWWLLPRGWLPWPHSGQRAKGWAVDSLKEGLEIARELASFGKWIVLSLLASVIALQGDLLVLSRLSGPEVVGVYSVALTLAMRLDLVNQSLYMVMMPRASRLQGRDQMRRYVRSVIAISGILACGLGVVALLAQPLIVLMYGERYAESARLFLVLLLAVLLELVTGSVFLVAFPLNKPRTLAVADWLRVTVLLGCSWLLVPSLGGVGAAIARLLSRATGTTVVVRSFWRDVQALPPGDEGSSKAAPLSHRRSTPSS